MNKKHYVFIVFLALMGGLIGGILSYRLGPILWKHTQEDKKLTKVIVANEFHLVDAQGRDRWVLALSKSGEPNMTFINQNGWAPMAFGMNQDGTPFFNMVLEPGRAGGPSFIMMDSRMTNRAVLGVKGDGEPYLNLFDSNGQRRAALGGIDYNNPLTGSTESRPCSSLVLFDDKGKVIFSAPQITPLPIQFSKYQDR